MKYDFFDALLWSPSNSFLSMTLLNRFDILKNEDPIVNVA